MADYTHLSNWQGWRAKNNYDHLDPFDRPIPVPSTGIFDNSNGDLRTVCFNPAWSPVLTGALSRLTVPELYLSGGVDAVQDVQHLINTIAGIGDNPCLPQSVDTISCAYYPSWYAGIEYRPHNPFSGNDAPDGYPVAPFVRFSAIDTWLPDWLDDLFLDLAEWATGYRENDVIVTPLSINTQSDPYAGLDYPEIKITVQGSGVVKLKFLLMPNGGRAIISIGDPVDYTDIFNAIFSPDDRIIELNRDIVALLPETDLDAIEEIVLEDDATHEIYIKFLPTINDEVPFLQYGGGFRGYEVCGNLTVINPITNEPIDFSDPDGDIYQEGVGMTTYQDFLDALDAHEKRRASRYLLAQDGNLADGATIDTSITSNGGGAGAGGVQLSGSLSGLVTPDVSASVEEARNGGVYRQATGIANLLSEFASLKAGSYTAEQIGNISRLVINPLDSANWQAIIDAYYAEIAVNIVIDVDALAEHLYCNSIGVGIVQYATEIVSSNPRHTPAETDYLVQFVSEIPSSTFSDWYAEGKLKPRSDYLGYGCYRQPNQVIEYTVAEFIADDSASGWIQIEKSLGVTFRFEISGQISDELGNVWDGIFLKLADGTITQESRGVLFDGSGGLWAEAPPELVYSPTGGYSFEIDIHSSYPNTYFKSYAMGGIQSAVGFMHSNTLSGSLTLTVIDLGAD